ncbi:hemerythrin HHE cation binding domain-containing protein [Saccharopolyspora erythraea NRRL 2338]|uniref:Uncharacterized protein n=2 Tax=Saccharopolyspora erythraea TaxID=1836 RepID=A4FHC1_SACEN|nr:hemerythrin domain-containing protein [Saccharopolyspora erythraea]EQD86851.1 hemerythrin [Saccharopolyspora erythraea D]PFG97146.1 hemerythrin HHE cation binding domain-containing protein [Saccharopolyspora erythraea NRRL 2338]QRK87349.1 hemerythrin domain-containing protein [Saccharopolyspora erythraea]CAM03446.1 hypothetical protein SACE_4177 [Saccharopolyspora erythraea NRRL 2338]
MAQEAQKNGDLVDVLIQDHRDVESAFGEYERGGLTTEARRDLVDHIITELVRHSVAEEQHLYPAAREHLPDGDRIADHEIREHADAESVMKQIEGLDPDSADFDRLVRKLISEIRHHIEDEESDLFPRLRDVCSPQYLQEMGDKIVQAKKIAPTRPHPGAPDRPPANKLLDPGVGMIDRIRDALTGRGR